MNRIVLTAAVLLFTALSARGQSPAAAPTPAPTGPLANVPVAPVTGIPSAGVPLYSPYGYIVNGYYKSGGVFVGGAGTLPFDSGYYLLGGTDGLARVAGSYRLVVPFGTPGSYSCPSCPPLTASYGRR